MANQLYCQLKRLSSVFFPKLLPILALVTTELLISEASAAVEFSSIFTSHMVLQRDLPVKVWGTAAAGENIKLTLGEKTTQAVANGSGDWIATLPAMPAGGPYQLSAEGTSTVVLSDVLVGEVWIASGQSNMEWYLKSASNGLTEVAQAAHPDIRFFHPARLSADTPLKSFTNAKWEPCSPATAAEQSAVAYFFARALQRELKVPIGIISVSLGGSLAESWISQEALEHNAAGAAIGNRWKALVDGYPEAERKYEIALAAFQAEQAKLPAGQPRTPAALPPAKPVGPGDQAKTPTGLFNGLISPLIPYTVRGVIWYQGESNIFHPEEYEGLMSSLIVDWRTRWNQGDYPFYFVQLPGYAPAAANPLIREAQAKTLKLANTGMVVAIDLGEKDNIHPTNKLPVGERLARVALARTYGQKIEDQGPTFSRLSINGEKAIVDFAHGEGLDAAGGAPRGFYIAGENRIFKPAETSISGTSVILSHPDIPRPVAVRYAWSSYPEVNLFNAAALPAAPFRTDTWPNK